VGEGLGERLADGDTEEEGLGVGLGEAEADKDGEADLLNEGETEREGEAEVIKPSSSVVCWQKRESACLLMERFLPNLKAPSTPLWLKSAKPPENLSKT